MHNHIQKTSATLDDPITYEVLTNAFNAVVEDMGAMLEKVSFSTVTSIGKDYVCAITTPGGDVFARGLRGLPLITGTVAQRVKAILDAIPAEEILDGDVFLINDPYLGGTHAQDVTAVMPVMDADGQVLCHMMSASHWPDMGGPVAGSFNSQATSTYAEALLLTPVHIVNQGVWNTEMERLILRNVRVPSVVKGDLRGMIEACRVGRDLFLKLAEKYGSDLLLSHQQRLLDQSERLLRSAIGEIPNGTYSFTDWIDRDPGTDSGEPIAVGLDLEIRDDEIVADFSRSGPQAVGPVNSPASATNAAVMAAMHSLFPDVAWNEGFERAITLVLGEASVLNSQFPRPVSGVAASPAEKAYCCVHGCMVQVIPERSMACSTNLVNLSLSGVDQRPGRGGRDYVLYLWMAGGWGGRPGQRDAHTSLYPMGASTNLQPVEFLERIYPLRFDAFELKPDSEGAGRHRGGFALHFPWRVTGGDALLNVQGDRQRLLGWGVAGGSPQQGNDVIYAPGTADEHRIDIMSADNPIAADTLVDCWQSGGGGWQTPLSREPAWVLDDVRDGLMSIERARTTYGVVIAPTDDLSEVTVDLAATQHERSLRAGTEPSA